MFWRWGHAAAAAATQIQPDQGYLGWDPLPGLRGRVLGAPLTFNRTRFPAPGERYDAYCFRGAREATPLECASPGGHAPRACTLITAAPRELGFLVEVEARQGRDTRKLAPR